MHTVDAVDAPYENAVRFQACMFDGNNNVGGEGGAVAVTHNDPLLRAVAVFRDCVFSGNNAGSGGAVYTNKNVAIQVHNATFHGNTADKGGMPTQRTADRAA